MPSNDPEYQKRYIREHYQKNKEYYKNKSKERKLNLSPEQRMFERIRTSSKSRNLEFFITIDDIVIPDVCPVFGIPLDSRNKDHSPSLDRVDNSKGYISGNVRVISNLANFKKSDLTIEQIRQLYEYALSN